MSLVSRSQGSDDQDGRPGPGDVTVFFDGDVTLVLLSGEIDLACAQDLEYAGRDAIDRDQPIRIDASAVTFIDSIGIGFIARMAGLEIDRGRQVEVSDAGQRVRDALTLAGLTSLMRLT